LISVVTNQNHRRTDHLSTSELIQDKPLTMVNRLTVNLSADQFENMRKKMPGPSQFKITH